MILDSIDLMIVRNTLNDIHDLVSLPTPAVWTDEDVKAVKEDINTIKQLLKLKE